LAYVLSQIEEPQRTTIVGLLRQNRIDDAILELGTAGSAIAGIAQAVDEVEKRKLQG
jgi:hypothetical protein